jgi:Holliday junction resolvase RusA-like endonuclease
VGKPRQTRSDRWKKRPEVERYRLWADEARLAATGSPLTKIKDETVLAIYAFFHFPLRESWSAAKKEAHYGRLHQAAPDVDNCLKATADALFGEDKTIPIMHGVKLWCVEGEASRTDVFLLSPATDT